MIRKRRFAIITAHEGLNRECFLHAKAGPTVAYSSLTLKNGEFAIRVALRKANREWSFSHETHCVHGTPHPTQILPRKKKETYHTNAICLS